jgi:hypothetical protein
VQSHAAIRKVVGRLAFAVGTAEVGRVLPKPVVQLDAMERVVRAFGILTQGQSLAIANEARELLEAALRLEPTLLPGLWMMSWPLDMAFALDPHPDRDRFVREMDEYSTRAVTLDPDIWLGWAGRSTALLLLGRWTASLEASGRQDQAGPLQRKLIQPAGLAADHDGPAGRCPAVAREGSGTRSVFFGRDPAL